jgi:hypothetical protein
LCVVWCSEAAVEGDDSGKEHGPEEDERRSNTVYQLSVCFLLSVFRRETYELQDTMVAITRYCR